MANRRRKGRVPKEESPDLLPVLLINNATDPGKVVLPESELHQSNLLGWRTADLRHVNRTLGLYDRLPMLCRGSDCFWAELCPTGPTFPFKGRLCPLEVIDAWRHFYEYVRELNVKPGDRVDLAMVADLVRLDVQISRIDMKLQVSGMETEYHVGIAQKNATEFKELQPNKLLKEQSQKRKDRNVLYDKLLANREARFEQELKAGNSRDNILSLMSDVNAAAKALIQQELEKQKAQSVDIVDAEYQALPPPASIFSSEE